MNKTEEKQWKLDVLDMFPLISDDHPNLLGRFTITNRYAEVFEKNSADAFINKRKYEIKVTLVGLVELYNNYWSD